MVKTLSGPIAFAVICLSWYQVQQRWFSRCWILKEDLMIISLEDSSQLFILSFALRYSAVQPLRMEMFTEHILPVYCFANIFNLMRQNCEGAPIEFVVHKFSVMTILVPAVIVACWYITSNSYSLLPIFQSTWIKSYLKQITMHQNEP